ncbi:MULTISPECIES: chromosome segregation protein ParM [Streptomyces]|uniref:Chromosome segregation protein ParM n=1 Tax=Streptomyces harbinensis TaxID=1176198 RepID=A0A1I6WAE6_9ACTN|nr:MULTISPECIES: chromosome segregation protein ParM [Streptomyces]SFT22965.1 hypothetical protein SAMN05444716_11615 [Streptomyces harbinensis]
MFIPATPRRVKLERLAYALAAPALVGIPHWAPGGPADTVIVGAGLAGALGTLLAGKSDAPGRTVMRWSPLSTSLALRIAMETTPEHIASHPGWLLDGALGALWAAAGCLITPLSGSARHQHFPARAIPAPPVPTPRSVLRALEPAVPAAPASSGDPFLDGVRHLWRRAGNPAETVVVKATRHQGTRHDLTMLLMASQQGRPIKGLTHADIAAALGTSEDVVTIKPVGRQEDGRQQGPGWLEVTVTPQAHTRRRAKPTTHEWWADRIGCDRGPIPGSTFVSKTRNEDRGVVYWRARLEDAADEPDVNLRALCKALGIPHADGRVFVTVDGPHVLIAVWDISPLAVVYPATRELLTPGPDGRWILGYLTNGQPARGRVFTDRGAAHGLYVAPSGGGKTQLMALGVCADANYGATVWLATEAPDEKTAALGRHIDRQGTGPLYMVRALRAALALMDIRANMPWADGQCHDWHPQAVGCPYTPLSLYLDEFLSAARDGQYGPEIMDLAEQVSVKGRKYGIGIKVAGQSVYVQDGFTQLLNENLRALSVPVVLNVAPKKIADMFKALGISPENIPEPLPRSFTKADEGRIERIMAGEPEPPVDSNTGGVGWIIESVKPEVMRALYMDFGAGIAHLFPEQIGRLTAHEIAEIDARDLWGDWNRPDEQPDDEDPDDDGTPSPRRRQGRGATGRHLGSAQEALALIKKLEKLS